MNMSRFLWFCLRVALCPKLTLATEKAVSEQGENAQGAIDCTPPAYRHQVKVWRKWT